MKLRRSKKKINDKENIEKFKNEENKVTLEPVFVLILRLSRFAC
jgi:cell fate (sporulation/competence/biofilm development) regulator YlbF (YheA/YmcA/DUF963 family)